jgi:hypothetical protein
MDNLKEYIHPTSNQTHYNGVKYLVPRKCPHCSNAISVLIVDRQTFKYSTDYVVNMLLQQCPDCSKNFITTHLRRTKDNVTEFISSYPAFTKHQHPETISKFSPRFVDVYNQAYIAEQMNHFTLAGTGYRIALEILIKDFAIHDNPDEEDKIKELSLNNCIQNYYKDLESTVSAHVVRKLGNDYAHYVQQFDSVEFTEVKYYLGIFTLNIEMKLKIMNPPVPVSVPNQYK